MSCGLLGLFGAATGLAVAWYAGLVWLIVALRFEDRPPSTPPADLGPRLDRWLWSGGVVLILLGALVGAALGFRALTDASSPGRLRGRRRRLRGGVVGALIGLVVGVMSVAAWSVARLPMDADAVAPSVSEQLTDLALFGLVALVPVCSSIAGAGLSDMLVRSQPPD
jgi:hypothetical protein